MPFAKTQPKPGELMVTCGHHGGEMHFFKLSPEAFALQGVSVFRVDWIVVCPTCLAEYGGNLLYLPVASVMEWEGEEPFVEEIQWD